MKPEPKLLEAFLQFGDVIDIDKATQAALRLCNHQIKKVIDATVISCKVKPADVALICGCNWQLKQLNIHGRWGEDSLRVLPIELLFV
jgi:hypothetical protein